MQPRELLRKPLKSFLFTAAETVKMGTAMVATESNPPKLRSSLYQQNPELNRSEPPLPLTKYLFYPYKTAGCFLAL